MEGATSDQDRKFIQMLEQDPAVRVLRGELH